MFIWIILILIFFNGLFVLIEMALVSSRPSRLESRAAAGNSGARTALRLLEQPNLYLSTVQIGITATGVALGAYGEEALSERLTAFIHDHYPDTWLAAHSHSLGFICTVLTLTLVIIVLAELVPKRLAQIAPESLACLGSRPMWLMSRICAPIVWLLSTSTDIILRIIPIRPAKPESAEAESEVKAIFASGTESGVFHRTEQQIVERVFKLGDQGVKALMVPRTDIDFLLLDDTPQRIRVALATSQHSHFPVCKTGLDDLIGVVHVKDLVKQTLIREDIQLAAIVKQPLFVPESTLAIRMVEIFREKKTHIAFVLDEYGVLEGLVTLNDILEALIGQVQRQGDLEDPSVVKRADGSLLLDGMLPVNDLKDLLKVEALPKEEMAGYETLGGFIMTYLGRIPATGDTFTWDRYKFEVVDMDKSRVDKVMLVIGPDRGLAAADSGGE